MCLVFFNVDVQRFDLSSFAIFASRSSSILLTSFPDSDPSCDIFNLADVADVFVANSIPQSVASDAS